MGIEKIREILKKKGFNQFFDIILYIHWPLTLFLVTSRLLHREFQSLWNYSLSILFMVIYIRVMHSRWGRMQKYLLITFFIVPLVVFIFNT